MRCGRLRCCCASELKPRPHTSGAARGHGVDLGGSTKEIALGIKESPLVLRRNRTRPPLCCRPRVHGHPAAIRARAELPSNGPTRKCRISQRRRSTSSPTIRVGARRCSVFSEWWLRPRHRHRSRVRHWHRSYQSPVQLTATSCVALSKCSGSGRVVARFARAPDGKVCVHSLFLVTVDWTVHLVAARLERHRELRGLA